jgi:hypothetical protein
MLLNSKEILPSLPNSARVWIYASSRPLSAQEKEISQNYLDKFVAQWSTHGSSMTAGACVFLDRFLIVAADEEKMAASGCSIDSSVRTVKEIGQSISVDFFDRLNVYIDTSEGIRRISYHDLKMCSGSRYFNLLVHTLGDIRSNWPEVIP